MLSTVLYSPLNTIQYNFKKVSTFLVPYRTLVLVISVDNVDIVSILLTFQTVNYISYSLGFNRPLLTVKRIAWIYKHSILSLLIL